MGKLTFTLIGAFAVLSALAVTPVQASNTTWLVPSGMTCPRTCTAAAMVGPQLGDGGTLVPDGADRSMGYSIQGDWRFDGASWPTLAFGCPGQTYTSEGGTFPMAWYGNDDNATYGTVKLAAPTWISGVRYMTLASSNSHLPDVSDAQFYVSTVGGNRGNYTQVADVETPLVDGVWKTVTITWPAVQASYFRWVLADDGTLANSFTNMLQARLLAPSTTPHSC